MVNKKSALQITPDMSNKNTTFYRGKAEVLLDFSAEQISSDALLFLLEKLERKHKLRTFLSTGR
ncbi:MAG TPA: hypothetical protein DDX98_04430 [Bacteroidales bacterium]|jgi:hypothetical protein|nr:hypothetical protein [Bacteroidales bacterium]